jgi:hypothetical protein
MAWFWPLAARYFEPCALYQEIIFSASTRLTTQMLFISTNNTPIVEHRDWHIILCFQISLALVKNQHQLSSSIIIMMVNYSTYWEYYNYFFPIKNYFGFNWSIIIHSWSRKLGLILGVLMHHSFVSNVTL